MTQDQAQQMLQYQLAASQYMQDIETSQHQALSFLAAIHAGLLILAGFLVVFGIIAAMQNRPRASS